VIVHSAKILQQMSLYCAKGCKYELQLIKQLKKLPNIQELSINIQYLNYFISIELTFSSRIKFQE